MSEKQVERVQSFAMWIVGGLATMLLILITSFTQYVLSRQDKDISAQSARNEEQDQKIEKLEEKYQSMLQSNADKIASIDKNLAVIAAKLNVDLK